VAVAKNNTDVKLPLIWVAELFSVLTAAGFLASIWMHQTVFSSWGLSYFQVATPSDVLMGGISTVALALLLTPWFLAGVAAAGGLHWATSFLPGARRWLDWPIGLASAVVAAAVFRNGITATFDASQFVLLAYGAAATWLALRLKPRFAEKPFRNLVVGVLILGLGMALAYSCGQRITFGFGGDPAFAAPLPGPYTARPRCEGERIVWIGQRALVVRCSGPALTRDRKDWEYRKLYLVLLNPDAVWLGNAEHMLAYDRDTRAYQAQEAAKAAGRAVQTAGPQPGQ